MLLVLWKRWFSSAPQPARPPDGGETLESRVAAAQAGDDRVRAALLDQYRPFAARTASQFSRRFIDPQRDDEFSIAMTALNEAIDRYAPDAGGRFLGFAHTVMTRRLIDYARAEKRHAASIPYSAVSDGEEEEGALSRIENAAAMEAYDRQLVADLRRAEIEALEGELSGFGIRFAELADGSPSHRDTRDTLLGIGRRLAANPEMYKLLAGKRQLPIKEICAAEGVSRKTVERHRKYLIAVALIAGGSYPYLQSYIQRESCEEEGHPS